MVAGAFLDQIGQGISNIFSNLGNNGARSGGGSGDLLGGVIRSILDPDKNSDGNGLTNIVKTVLTPENLNTVKDLLRNYWGNHKNEEDEVRKNMDMLRMSLGKDGMAGELAKTIQCIEDEMTDEECGLGLRINLDSTEATMESQAVTEEIESLAVSAQVGQ